MTCPLLRQIEEFSSPNVFNPWREIDPMDLTTFAPILRGNRLMAHFDVDAEFVLIGEAPGYQGCHFSGVAFTNEQLICAGKIPRIDDRRRFTSRPRPWCEPSATIVWGLLHELGIAESVVMWNAFAFHPHKPGELYSNRAPTRAELAAAAPILRAVLDRFSAARYVAVGNVAQAALRTAGIQSFATVRHPSMGGANKFREQMRALGAREAA